MHMCIVKFSRGSFSQSYAHKLPKIDANDIAKSTTAEGAWMAEDAADCKALLVNTRLKPMSVLL